MFLCRVVCTRNQFIAVSLFGGGFAAHASTCVLKIVARYIRLPRGPNRTLTLHGRVVSADSVFRKKCLRLLLIVVFKLKTTIFAFDFIVQVTACKLVYYGYIY